MKNYDDFIKSKYIKHQDSGFNIELSELNSSLFDFQKHIVQKALKKGRYAIFADCGLGKTFMQLEWANQVHKHTKNPVLILCPLAVAKQTIEEGKRFGIKVDLLDIDNLKNSIQIINYEQLKNIDCSAYSGVVLDESSILKNFTGKMKNLIIHQFEQTPYKLACTATPAPNDLNEIGNHSQFLNVMDANDMRMRWFVRDEGMNNYRLKGHASSEFYGWISGWASVLRNPNDIGFNADGYKLPPLKFIERKIFTEQRDNGKLFNDTAVSATQFNKELKLTIIPRLELVSEMVNNSNEPFIVWVNQNQEEKEALKLIPDAVAVNGSEKPHIKESKLLGFAKGDFRVLVTKKKIAQFGLNYQHCRNQVFASLDFSFEGLYQAIRRSYRFGQKNEVNIYLITTDTMQNVKQSIERKQSQFNEMMEQITTQVNEKEYKLKSDYKMRELKGEDYHIINGDSVEAIDLIPDNSLGFSVFSPPFSNLFTYSDNIRDMGNCENDEEFFKQTDYLLSKLYKKMKQGRLVAVHTKDLARYKGSSGFSGMYDFTGEYHRAMEKAGFKYHSKICIWIDPVLEMQRTKTQRLLYKQLRKDSSYSGIGMPEYVTIFRKWEGDEKEWTPITNKNVNNFDLNRWQRWASPVWGDKLTDSEIEQVEDFYKRVLDKGIDNIDLSECQSKYIQTAWFDIKRTNVLNNFRHARQAKDEKHICPLQLDLIERCIVMWSNPGETVFTPFMGIGSEVVTALKLQRKAIGIELKPSYFDVAIKNINVTLANRNQLTLF